MTVKTTKRCSCFLYTFTVLAFPTIGRLKDAYIYDKLTISDAPAFIPAQGIRIFSEKENEE